MEEQWVVDRCKLREVWLDPPDWSKRKLAQAVGGSRSWVKKWLKRIRGSTLEDREMLNGHSCARKQPPAQVAPEVVERILEIRDHPPQKLGRTPGPLTLLYYLKQDTSLTEAGVLVEQGCPDRIRLDRDPRWVGSWTAKDFPSPRLRFLQCLRIAPQVCPPQRLDKNPFVERDHRNFKYECQLINPPHDLASTVDINRPYVRFYNFERPNQAIPCGNQPPRVMFPRPPHPSPVPQTMDPERWLLALTGKTYKRRLDRNGCFQLGNQTY